jgi:hypothetical protein
MGTKFSFECPACDYSVVVSAGVDFGMVAVVQPMLCSDCQEITDVIIGEEGEIYPRQPLKLGEPRLYLTKHIDSDEFYVCSNCKKDHLSDWKNNECPKCNGTMKNVGEAMLWD